MSLDLESYPRYAVEIYSYMNEIVKRVSRANIDLERHNSFSSLLEEILLDDKKEELMKRVVEIEEQNGLSVMVMFNDSYVQRFYIREPDFDDKVIGIKLVGSPNEIVYKQFEVLLEKIGLKIKSRPLSPNSVGEVYYYDSKIKGYLPLKIIKKEYKRDISGPILLGGYDF